MNPQSTPQSRAAEVMERLKQSLETVKCYLGNGGLFNPEYMEHEKVRDMVMDMRDRITAALVLIEQGERDNHEMRTMLYVANTGMRGYHDDGELQDNRCHPFIDFKRNSIAEIQAKFAQRNLDAAREQPTTESK